MSGVRSQRAPHPLLNGANQRLLLRPLRNLVAKLLAWFPENARDLPWRRTSDPYAIWVSEIMLQQTQVVTVVPYFDRWMRELPTIESLAGASPEKLHKLWEGLGYYTRVRNMQKAARIILDQHGGRFPTGFEDLLALPGIGRYTAGAICSIAFDQAAPIVDGNVVRVLTRVFDIRDNIRDRQTNARLWQLAEELVRAAASFRRDETDRAPHRHPALHSSERPAVGSEGRRDDNTVQRIGPCSALNQSLMELGATICSPRQPQCGLCPIRRQCRAREQRSIERLPNLGKRSPATARRFVALVLERGGKLLARQRPAGTVNAHLWEFPNAELSGGEPLATAPGKLCGNVCLKLVQLCTVRHSITRYRITVEALRGVVPPSFQSIGLGQWVTPGELDRLALTSAHRKILRAFTALQRNKSIRVL